MCLIVAKPRGQPMPGKKRLKRWFDSYHDGMGLAFQNNGEVRVIKGAMNHAEMFEVINIMKQYLKKEDKTPVDVDVVVQYRQAFTGSVCPEYCHPFPVTKDRKALNALNVTAGIALAHNGVIWEYNDRAYDWRSHNYSVIDYDINDAQEFIVDYLVDMGNNVWNSGVMKLIHEYTQSKFTLLSKNKMKFIGEFIEDGGLYFSNDGYKEIKKPVAVAYPINNFNVHEIRGEICPYCDEKHYMFYNIPDDDDSAPACWKCFQYFTGRNPLEGEKVW